MSGRWYILERGGKFVNIKNDNTYGITTGIVNRNCKNGTDEEL